MAKTVNGVTTHYLVDTLNPTGYAQVLEEIENGTVVRRYTYGLDLISQHQAGGVSFYGYDGHGSVRGLTDEIGVATDQYNYEAFGAITSVQNETQNGYLYSGENFDKALGFYFLRARFMNPVTGRFLTQDLISRDLSDASMLHPYAYADADPVNRSDRTGYFALDLFLNNNF
ncbi:MAG: RHS repeat-associated core domain-containing protein [Candidatus Competibacteraceae bacterium]